MEQVKQNKMATTKISKLIWKMGLPMIVSMILQSVYNIVDTAFVINMGDDGILSEIPIPVKCNIMKTNLRSVCAF